LLCSVLPIHARVCVCAYVCAYFVHSCKRFAFVFVYQFVPVCVCVSVYAVVSKYSCVFKCVHVCVCARTPPLGCTAIRCFGWINIRWTVSVEEKKTEQHLRATSIAVFVWLPSVFFLSAVALYIRMGQIASSRCSMKRISNP